MGPPLTNNDIGFRSSVRNDVETVVVTLDDCDIGKFLSKFCWNVAEKHRNIPFRMCFDDSVEDCASNVASHSSSKTKLVDVNEPSSVRTDRNNFVAMAFCSGKRKVYDELISIYIMNGTIVSEKGLESETQIDRLAIKCT